MTFRRGVLGGEDEDDLRMFQLVQIEPILQTQTRCCENQRMAPLEAYLCVDYQVKWHHTSGLSGTREMDWLADECAGFDSATE